MFQPNLIQQNFLKAAEIEADSLIVPVIERDILLHGNDLPHLKELSLPENTRFLEIGSINGTKCYGTWLNEETDVLTRCGGRELLANAPVEVHEAFCRAREMIFWRRQHRYCGCCQTELTPSTHDLAMVCGNCGAMYFPQIAPAVIVAITRNQGKEILLAHNRNFRDHVFSLIAGFVEAGESAEQAVHREIREETGIEVANPRYISSQSWPFPNSLMLAFRTEYLSGEACADGTELSECRWFPRENLPDLPRKGSIARAVLDLYVAGSL